MRVIVLALLAVSSSAFGQSWGPRTLEELKQETVRRAERNIVPLTGIKAGDAREAMANLKSLEPDDVVEPWVLRHLGVDTFMLAQATTEKPAPKKEPKADDKEKEKPKPRVGIQKDGARGGDAPGHGGASSLGGTPGTPSGSFTR